MSAFAIVALELAILYIAVWFVLVRKPQQRKVDRPIWGVYPEHEGELHKRNNVILFSSRYEGGAKLVDPNEPESSGPKAA